MRRKSVALLVLVIVMVSAVYATAAPIVVTAGVPAGLYGFLSSICGTTTVLCDPVPGTGGSGGDN